MKAVQYVRSVPRYLTVRALSKRFRSVATGPFSVLRYGDIPEPELPGPHWLTVKTRLSGICGSDLATITAKGSAYFSPFVSTPFVLGHEVVGDVASVGAEVAGVSVGTRVVLEPVLHCAIRGIQPVCRNCAQGREAACENVTKGDLSAGIQTGYCRDTGGAWSPLFVAHEKQVHPVPDEMSDRQAVLIEPLACCVHAVLQAHLEPDQTVLVLGCGTIGLLTIAAIRGLGHRNRILASAKYEPQIRLARALGADETIPVGRGLYDGVPNATGAEVYRPDLGKPILIGGVDVAFDCVGSAASIDDALRMTRAGGTVILVGMPGIPKGVDWTSVWYKELHVRGAYAYGRERFEGREVRTFALAMEIMRRFEPPLEELVDARYPLARYREAIQNALQAGRRGSTKTAFEFPTQSR